VIREIQDLALRVMAMRASDVLDIVIVAALLYALLYLVRGTRAIQLVKGVVLFLAPFVILFINSAELLAFNAVLQRVFLPSLLVAIPVIFQPELRRAIERLGRTRLILNRTFFEAGDLDFVKEIARSARKLSEKRFGALVVLERETGLSDLIERGTQLDAEVSAVLLEQLFYPNTPLHDGAVIIRGGRIAAARVVIPHEPARDEVFALGTRHLAAVSISDSTDALAVVVSEETGTISLARDGRLTRHLDEASLRRMLRGAFEAQPPPAERARRRIARTIGGLPAPLARALNGSGGSTPKSDTRDVRTPAAEDGEAGPTAGPSDAKAEGA